MSTHKENLKRICELNLELRALSKKMHETREEMAGILRGAREEDRKELESLKKEIVEDLESRIKKMESILETELVELPKLFVTDYQPEYQPEYQPDPRCLSLIEEEESAGMDQQFCQSMEGHVGSCSSRRVDNDD